VGSVTLSNKYLSSLDNEEICHQLGNCQYQRKRYFMELC